MTRQEEKPERQDSRRSHPDMAFALYIGRRTPCIGLSGSTLKPGLLPFDVVNGLVRAFDASLSDSCGNLCEKIVKHVGVIGCFAPGAQINLRSSVHELDVSGRSGRRLEDF